jgi:hypothetical protein
MPRYYVEMPNGLSMTTNNYKKKLVDGGFARYYSKIKRSH